MRYRGVLRCPCPSAEADIFYCRQWEKDKRKDIVGVECVYSFEEMRAESLLLCSSGTPFQIKVESGIYLEGAEPLFRRNCFVVVVCPSYE